MNELNMNKHSFLVANMNNCSYNNNEENDYVYK